MLLQPEDFFQQGLNRLDHNVGDGFAAKHTNSSLHSVKFLLTVYN